MRERSSLIRFIPTRALTVDIRGLSPLRIQGSDYWRWLCGLEPVTVPIATISSCEAWNWRSLRKHCQLSVGDEKGGTSQTRIEGGKQEWFTESGWMMDNTCIYIYIYISPSNIKTPQDWVVVWLKVKLYRTIFTSDSKVTAPTCSEHAVYLSKMIHTASLM